MGREVGRGATVQLSSRSCEFFESNDIGGGRGCDSGRGRPRTTVVMEKEAIVSIKDKAKDLVQSSIEKVEKVTGKVLGDENMPAKDQVEELKGHAKGAGERVKKLTGKALGDENLSTKDQVEELKEHLKGAGGKIKGAFKKNE